jgi:hypothetical protein
MPEPRGTRKTSFEEGGAPPVAKQVPVAKRARRRLVRRKAKVKAERIGCSSCGAPIEVRNMLAAEMVSCSYCGSVLDLESDKHEVLHKILTDQRPYAPLKIGDKGKLKGVLWEIIGRLQLSEEGDKWDEFLLFNPQMGYAWLQLDEGHWVYFRKAKNKPMLQAESAFPGQNFRMLGKQFKVVEKSAAKISYIEGEFSYQAKAGDVMNYLDAVAPPLMVSAEWSAKELEWLIGEYMTPEAVKAAFGLDRVPRPMGVGKCQPFEAPKWRTRLAWAFAAVAALFFLMIFVSMVPGKKTNTFTALAPQYLKTAANTQGYLSGPIKVESDGIMQVEFHAPVSNSWVYLDAMLLDEKKNPMVIFSGNLSYYKGYSGGEHWSEGSQYDKEVFVVDKPGTYYLALLGQGGQGNYGTVPRREAVTVTVYQGVWLQRYFVIGAILCGLFPLLEFMRRRKFEASRVEDDDDD